MKSWITNVSVSKTRQARDAQELSETGKTHGKVILKVA
jgi:hypothetical protein